MRISKKSPSIFLLSFAVLLGIAALGGTHPALGFTLSSQYGADASSAAAVNIFGAYNSVSDPPSPGQGDGLTTASSSVTTPTSDGSASAASSVNTVTHSISSSSSATCPDNTGCIDNNVQTVYNTGGSTEGSMYDTYTLTCASCYYIDLTVSYTITGSFLALDNGPVCQQGNPPGSLGGVACRATVDPEILLGNSPICQGYQGSAYYSDGCPQAVIDYQQGWNFCQGGGDVQYYCPSSTTFSLSGTADLSQVLSAEGRSFSSAYPSPGTSLQLGFLLTAETDVGLPGNESVSGAATFNVSSSTPGVTITSAASGQSVTTPPGASTTIVQLGSSNDAVGTPVTVTGSAYSLVTSGVVTTGTLSWSSSGSGTFSSSTCALSGEKCSVTYTPTSSAGSPVTISASYGGDASNLASSGNGKLTVTGPALVSTTTGVSCLPASITTSSSSSSTCTATVAGGSTPTGTVLFSSTSPTGSFSPSTSCSLVSGSCSVTYVDSTAGNPTITGTYSGDSGHFASSGSSSVSVASPPITLSLTSSSGESGSTTTLSGTGYTVGLPYGACLGPSATDLLSCIVASAIPFTPTAGGAIPSGVVLTVPGGTTPGAYYILVATNGNIVVSSAPFTVVPTPITLSLTSSSGEAGSTTTVSGTGYIPGVTYDACLNPTATQVQCIPGSDAPFTPTSAGAIPSGVVVAVPYPSTTPGSYYVTVVAESGTDAVVSSAPFTILPNSETLSLTPSSAQTGSTTTLSGTGYTFGVEYVACLGSSATDISSCIAASAVPFTPTSAGAIPSGVVLTVPYGTPSGPYYVLAVVQYGPTLVSSAPFTVVPTPITLSLTSSSGQALSNTTLGGSGYSPSVTYAACLNPSSSQSSCITASVVTFAPTAVGVIPGGVVVTVPVGTSPGPYYVTVVDTGTLAVVSSAPFTVLSPTPITLSLTSSSGEAGSTTTISGSGYTTGLPYAACLNPSATDLSSCIAASAVGFTPTAGGAIPSGVVLTVPAGTTPGPYYVVVGTNGNVVVSSAPFTVVALPPSIVLSPSSGYVGQAFTVTGSAFSPGEGITVTFGGTSLGVTTASSTGAWTLPAEVIFGSTVGPATVTATGSTTDSASATFTVLPAPTLALSPLAYGKPGSLITAYGSNYPPGSTVTVSISFVGVSGSTVLGTALAASDGSFSASGLMVPSTAPGGFATVTATAVGGAEASTTYDVTPYFNISPISGYAGQALTFTGDGWMPGETVTWEFSAGVPFEVNASSSGTFTLQGVVPVPNPARVGTPSVVEATGAPGESADAPFEITAVPAVSVTPAYGGDGSVFTATGSNFPAGSTVSITFDYGVSTFITVGSAYVDAGGSFSATNLIVPSAAPPGFATVQATVQGVTPVVAFATTFDVVPSISISPPSGSDGQAITISGSAFAPGESVAITWGGATYESLSASSAGTFTLPGDVIGPAGTITVKATGSTGDSATTTFTVVAAPTLGLSPNSGGPGSTFTATGTNFPAGSTVSITFAYGVSSSVTIGSAVVNSTGAFTATNLIVPSAASGGFATVQATAQGVSPEVAAAAEFGVVPSISIVPSSGFDDSLLTISGSAFSPGESITITWGGATYDSLSASSAGTFTLPGDVIGPVGAVTVKATGSTGDTASTTFMVTASPTLTLTPSSGSPGSTFMASGSNFPAGSTVSITFATSSSTQTVGSALVDSTGAFTATNLMVPSAATGGFATVQATAQGVSPLTAAAAGFDVTPSIILSVSTGYFDTPFTLSGSGFVPGEAVSLTFQGTVFLSTVASPGGGITAASDVVPGVALGADTVKASGSSGDQAIAIFTVLASPTLTLTPGYGGPGSTFSATGANFPAGSTVSITFSPVSGPGSTLGSALVGSAGSFSAPNLMVPVASSGGFATVQATAEGVTPFAAAAAGFDVVPSIVLSPSSGYSGQALTIYGYAFVPGESVGVTFGTTSFGITVASGTGTFTFPGDVVGSTPGPVTVKADGVTGDAASATFTITAAPTLILSPSSGGPGSTFSASGSNYPAGTTVSITFDYGVSSGATIGSAAVDSSGSFTATNLIVPSAAPGGFATVQATVQGVSPEVAAATGFDVTPALVVSPSSGFSPQPLTISGYAFSPGESITIKFGTISFGTVTADSSGAFTLPGDVPGGSPLGPVTVKATGSTGDSATATFTVTAAPTLALTPNSGGPGSTFTASGSNFPAGTTVSITFSPATGPGSTIGSALVGSTGSFSATNLSVPTSIPGGFATVQATVQGVSPEVAAAAGFGVTPSIVLSPPTGAVGSFFFVQASSFVPLENVNIYFGSGLIASDIASPAGSFSAEIIVPSHSSGPVTVKALGASGDSASATFTIPTPPSIALTPSSGPDGSSFQVAGSNFQPGSTVTITFGSSVVGSATPSSAGSFTDTLIVPTLASGTNTVTASGAGSSASAKFTVSGATTLTVQPYDASSSLPWGVTEVTGASAYDVAVLGGTVGPTPTGSVTYNFYTNAACSSTPTSSDTVTLSGGTFAPSSATGALAAGAHSTSATYSGDTNYQASSSSCQSFQVGKGSATITTAVDPSSSVPLGTKVTDTATATGVAGFPPTGTVSINIYSGAACSGPVLGLQSGLALGAPSTSFAPAAAGPYSYQATNYSGDSNYASGSSAPCETFTVQAATTSTGVACTPSPATLGAPTTCTATVAGYHPSGTVTFSSTSSTGVFAPAKTCTLSAGACSLSYTDTTAGSPTISASYSGDASNLPSSGSTSLTESYKSCSQVSNGGGQNLKGANLEYCNLGTLNLSGANLQGANLNYTDLQNANLKGANLQGATLANSNAAGANFQGANMQSAVLPNTIITGDNFQGVNLQKADLAADSASGANFQGANMQSANLSGGDFDHVNFQGANMQKSNMSNGDFNYANFQGANTQGAIITGATFVGATNPP